MKTVQLCVSLICELLNLDSCLYCYLYIIQLCIYHHFQGISLSSLLTISGVPQIFKLGNIFEHLLLDFNFIFYHLGNPFYKVGEYFCSPTSNLSLLLIIIFQDITFYTHNSSFNFETASYSNFPSV